MFPLRFPYDKQVEETESEKGAEFQNLNILDRIRVHGKTMS